MSSPTATARRSSAQLPEAQGALVALDPNDGAVAALVGGFDYFDNKFNRVTQARRQPGSGFKPFLYSAALENGFTPATIVMDAPIVYDDSGQEKIWRPENIEKSFDGPMRLREALVHSRNLVTIRVVRQLGIDTAINYAAKFGFNPTDMPKDMTIALGSLPATPLQMATAYAVFANGGYRVDALLHRSHRGCRRQVVYQAKPKVVCELLRCRPSDAPSGGSARRSAPAAHRCALTPRQPQRRQRAAERASGDPDHAPANPLAAADRPATDRPACDLAAECLDHGRHDGRRDQARHRHPRRHGAAPQGHLRQDRHHQCGGTPGSMASIAISSRRVWVGFDQERPLGEGEEGSRTAVPIWINFMREALRGQPDRPRPMPPGLVTVRISPKTGTLAGANDGDAIYETFMEDHLPPAAQRRQFAVPATARKRARQQRAAVLIALRRRTERGYRL